MSIRHQMRQKVEELFKLFIDKTSLNEETVIYAVFIPKSGEVDEDSIEIFEQEVNPRDSESLEKFFSRVTKVALENDVKNLKLYGYAYDRGGSVEIIAPESDGEINEVVKELIERTKEEI
ncbi:MAG TPA: hypothetical protein EYG91_06420 [Aquifex aeolicus]|nr:hypothetical protein [Aquifex aeolicus]